MPDPAPMIVEKTYRVTGPNRVLDHQPGEEFTASLHPEQERTLIEGGHLTIVSVTGPAKNASREEWDAHAASLGINPTAFASKDELIGEVERVTGGGA